MGVGELKCAWKLFAGGFGGADDSRHRPPLRLCKTSKVLKMAASPKFWYLDYVIVTLPLQNSEDKVLFLSSMVKNMHCGEWQ
jgi:hypothetical protein